MNICEPFYKFQLMDENITLRNSNLYLHLNFIDIDLICDDDNPCRSFRLCTLKLFFAYFCLKFINLQVMQSNIFADNIAINDPKNKIVDTFFRFVLPPIVNFINIFTYEFFVRTLFWQLFLRTYN